MKRLGRDAPLTTKVVFPRIRAGASLKRDNYESTFRSIGRFPPHSCGGLIEAVP